MSEPRSYTLLQLTVYFLKLGSIGFGGPVALVGYMYRDLVEKRKWIAEGDYKEGLALAQLMPGPPECARQIGPAPATWKTWPPKSPVIRVSICKNSSSSGTTVAGASRSAMPV